MALAEWINLSRTSGSEGTTNIVVTASTYSGLIERTTSLKVKTRHTNLSANVDIIQASYYQSIPLTFEVVSGDGYLFFTKAYFNESESDFNINLIEYSKNGGDWTTLQLSNGYDDNVIRITQGDVIQFRGNNATYSDGNVNHIFQCFDTNRLSVNTPQVNVYGNIMSLINSTNYITNKTLTASHTFRSLFLGVGYWISSAENLKLPATTLTPYCYARMFADTVSNPRVSKFTTPPSELPATTLTDGCYYQMFQWCTSLTTVPVLSATTLASSCYDTMFQGCHSLTSVPTNYLPITTLAGDCYHSMFQDCTSLTTAPELPATTLASNCYSAMFAGCTNLTSVPSILPATKLAYGCYGSMFSGCTSLTTAPALPATTVATYCYYYMFAGCTNLTNVPSILPATNLSGTYRCYYGMFLNCTSLTTAPVLPATTLASQSYQGMFVGCSSLNYIKCLATNISAYNCTTNWVDGVASSGTFVKNPNMNDWTIGISGIPTNWMVISADKEEEYKMPLTFEITGDGNIVWKLSIFQNLGSPRTIEYKLNDGNWTSITSTSAGVEIPVVSGDTIQFRGNNNGYGDNVYDDDLQETIEYANCFGDSTAQFSVKGNIMSLINSSNFNTLTTLSSTNTFYYLFYNCTGLTDASELLLPATTLTDSCYESMFRSCTALTSAPELPATTLANYCYQSMFAGCSSLTSAPELPATTLAGNCYSTMFLGCHSLTTAPDLPATTLTNQCYVGMFNGCSGLTTAPELPATTLTTNCYYKMFYNCSNLSYIKCLATDISATFCTSNWVRYVASTGTFVKNPNMNDWTTGKNGIPTNWTIQDAS